MRILIPALACLLLAACNHSRVRTTFPGPEPFEIWRFNHTHTGLDDRGRAAILEVRNESIVIAAGSLHGLEVGQQAEAQARWGGDEFGTTTHLYRLTQVGKRRSVAELEFWINPPRTRSLSEAEWVFFSPDIWAMPDVESPRFPPYFGFRHEVYFGGDLQASVLRGYGDEGFIGVGSEHGVLPGDTFTVFCNPISISIAICCEAEVIRTWPRTSWIRMTRKIARWTGDSEPYIEFGYWVEPTGDTLARLDEPESPAKLEDSPHGPWGEWGKPEAGVIVGEVTIADTGRQGKVWLVLFEPAGGYLPSLDELLAIPQCTGDLSPVLKVIRRYHVDEDPDKPIEEIGAEVVGEIKFRPAKGMTVVAPIQ